jgi:hypothetical protein
MCYQSTLGHLGKQEVQMASANKLQNGVPKKLQSFVVLDAKAKTNSPSKICRLGQSSMPAANGDCTKKTYKD